MNEGRITGSALQDEVLRGQVMKTPDDVTAMMRLKSLGWGAKRIARELGCSHHTVKGYVAAGHAGEAVDAHERGNDYLGPPARSAVQVLGRPHYEQPDYIKPDVVLEPVKILRPSPVGQAHLAEEVAERERHGEQRHAPKPGDRPHALIPSPSAEQVLSDGDMNECASGCDKQSQQTEHEHIGQLLCILETARVAYLNPVNAPGWG